MFRWKTSRDKIILINYFNLESLVDHSNSYQKYLSSAVLEDIGRENFLQIICDRVYF